MIVVFGSKVLVGAKMGVCPQKSIKERKDQMHEWAMAEEILTIVDKEKEAQEDRDLSPVRIIIEVGGFSNVVPEALRFGLEVLLKNRDLEGTEVEIEEAPLVVHCEACGADSHLESPKFICPFCDSQELTIVSGQDVMVKSILFER